MKRIKDSAARLVRLREFRVSHGAVGFWEKGERPIPGPVLKLLELHEQHFISAPDQNEIKDQNHELSMQWAKLIVSGSNVKSVKTRRELQTHMAGVIQHYLGEGLSEDLIKRRVQLSVADRLIRSLGKARGIPLKAAQLASYLDMNVPEELREALLNLQAQAEPLSSIWPMKVKFLILLASLLYSSSVFAQVYAMPGFQQIGTVPADQSRTVWVTFTSQSSRSLQGVNASCSGNYAVFSCFSSCYMLMPYGSCTVTVTFRPMTNDGMTQNINVSFVGPGVSATAIVYGTDAL